MGKLDADVRTFGTMTRDLLELSDWLAAHGVTHVAMEATGVLWKPVWNILDGSFELLLVNPRGTEAGSWPEDRHQGRPMDCAIARRWLVAQQFCAGPAAARLRDLTRHRARLRANTRERHRIHKLLEDANIKLGSVASDILGVSGREDTGRTRGGRGRRRKTGSIRSEPHGSPKSSSWNWRLQGKVSPHHRFMLKQLLGHLDHLDQQIGEFTARIEELMLPFVDKELQEKLDAIPGVKVITIQNVTAEIGTQMNQFPQRCPSRFVGGNVRATRNRPANESGARPPKATAGCDGPSPKRPGRPHAPTTAFLAPSIIALPAEGAKKRALLVVGHTLLVIIYHIIKNRLDYQDLGPDYFLRFRTLSRQKPLPGQASGTTRLRGATLAEKHAA